MPTIVTHALLPLVAVAILPVRISTPLILTAMAAAVVPDLDVIGFRFGMAYSDPLGHRGATHSIAFAIMLGALAAMCATWLGASRRCCFLVVAVATASHPLTDMLTNGGLGAALFWPFNVERYFFPFRPVDASVIGVSRFFASDGVGVLASEALWLLLPVALIALFVRILSARRGPVSLHD